MTEWNPNDPYDLGIWDELGESFMLQSRTKNHFARKTRRLGGQYKTLVNGKRPTIYDTPRKYALQAFC